MTKLYNVVSPQELIDQFERMAKIAEVSSVGAAYGVQERALYKREAITWQAAADILRQTEFIGWPAAITDTTHLDALKDMAERDGEALDKIGPGKVMHAPPGIVPHPTAHLTDEQIEAMHRERNRRDTSKRAGINTHGDDLEELRRLDRAFKDLPLLPKRRRKR